MRLPPAARPHPQDDPVLAALQAAPVDDQPETEAERAAVEAAKTSARMVSHADVLRMMEDGRADG